MRAARRPESLFAPLKEVFDYKDEEALHSRLLHLAEVDGTIKKSLGPCGAARAIMSVKKCQRAQLNYTRGKTF